MYATITISQLALSSHIGAYAAERLSPQKLYLDLEVDYEIDKCVKSDRIEDAIDYDKIALLCKEVSSSKEFHLLETLAVMIVKKVLKAFPCTRVRAKLHKKNRSISVELTK